MLEERRLLSVSPSHYIGAPQGAIQQQVAQSTPSGAVRQDTSLHANTLPETDDGFFGSIQLGFPINLGGEQFQTTFINANGSVSFGQRFASPLIPDLPQTTTSNLRVLAPFYSDIDTRDGGGTITYGTGQIDGRSAFAVSWNEVAAYRKNQTSRNSFQLVIIDRSDLHPGAFDLEFNYDKIEWDIAAFTTDPTNSWKYFGVAGTHSSAVAAFQNQVQTNTTTVQSWKAVGSKVTGSFLDSNLHTGLVHSSLNSDVDGRYTWLIAERFIGVNHDLELQTNQGYSGLVSGFFDTANLVGRATAYAASIDWGDGQVTAGSLTKVTDTLSIHHYPMQGASYRIHGSHTYSQPGDYLVTTTVLLPGGSSHQINSHVSVVGSQLSLTKPSPQSNLMGEQVGLQVNAGGANLIYAARRLPNGLRIDAATGFISGTILASTTVMTHNVEISVSDGRSTLFETFGWTVGVSTSGPVVTVHTALGGLHDDSGLNDASFYPSDVPASFTLLRDSYHSGQPTVTVYFQLYGTAVYGVDYTLSFGGRDVGLRTGYIPAGAGYVDESTGQGYVTFQAGFRFAMLFVDSLYSGSAAKTVGVEILGQGNQFGGAIGYQMPPQSGGAAVQPLPKATANFSVSGTFQFAGTAPNSGPAKPVRNALVRVYMTDNHGLTAVAGESYTATDGSFVVLLPQYYSQATAVTVRVYTYSRTLYARTRVDVRSWAQTHYKDFPIFQPPSSTSPNQSTGVISIDDSDISGKAFWVYDSIMTGVQFANAMGPIPFFPDSTTVDFPAASMATTSYTLFNTPHIREVDYDIEDKVLHEFGHAYAQLAGFFPYAIVAKGYARHSGASDHRGQYTWSEELLKLSFSEGWANFFSVAARFVPGSVPPSLEGVDPEFNDLQSSETDELAIMRLLWDLADPVAPSSSQPNPPWTDESHDRIELQYQGETGFRALFKLMTAASRPSTVGELYNRLLEVDPAKANDYAKLFALHGAGVNSVEMTDGLAPKTTWTAADSPPTFRWNIPTGRVGQGVHVMNTFSIAIYDSTTNSTNLLHLGAVANTLNGSFFVANDVAYWTPSQSLWNSITQTTGAKKFQVWAWDEHAKYAQQPFSGMSYYINKTSSTVYRSPLLDFIVSP
ncbi:nidogen-like domain-containing protein [Paludisphaera soli]|uniref:nidogen-like domain-containing protein n=1 Tax=Paludisphaera soli TaxID=2712865 RepID=UPI0013ED3877|nr:nidogen-like domain-containing protein [Paludisphaera soli]